MNGRVESTHRERFKPLLTWMLAAFLVIGIVAAMGMPVLGQEAEELDGYMYTVEDGDSWDIVADKTGVSVEALQEANPDAVRDTGWLLTGEQLTIPLPEDAQVREHTVESGQSWSTIAAQYDITVDQLQAANQRSIRPGLILYNGEKLFVPPPSALDEEAEAAEEAAPEATEAATEEAEAAVDEAAAEATPEATEPAEETPEATEAAAEPESADAEEAAEGEAEAETEPVTEMDEEVTEDTAEPAAGAEEAAEEATEEPAEEATGEAAVETTDEVTATETLTETVIEAEIPDAAGEEAEEAAAPLTCPEALADYPDTVVTLLNSADGSVDALTEFLTTCGAAMEDGVVAADLTGDGVEELVVVYKNPSQETSFVESDLIILSATEEGYEVAYRARAAGEVRLVATEDVNADGQADVVWIDTTCGASTCFDTVNVRSWDGSVWADWTDGTITMAYADIELAEVSEEGSGQEIELTGGIYGSVGAGPQRSRTEIWSSVDGQPYALVDKTYSASECLYHTVLDANRALSDAVLPEDLEAARGLYEKAVTDESLIKCWVRPAELEELRSFSLFRLALIAAYGGDTEGAVDRITELAATYPDGVMVEAGQTWLDTFEADGDVSAACDAMTAFAEENPEVWEILADYGYTNPSFEASDLCPPPDVSGEGTEEEPAEDGATGASPRSDLGAESDPEATGESDAVAEVEDDTVAVDDLPGCPATLVDYEGALPALLADTNGDTELVERWMYACGGLADDRGAVVTADLNGDEVDDYVMFPTVISDVGLGPDGAQGAVYILHSGPDGEFELVASPEVFGEPRPLAIEDLNGDGSMDVAWTVEGCSTFCVLEAQIATWDGEEYVSLIQPGAAIAAGEAAFEAVGAEAVGDGQALVLVGGVSGTPEGGLTVPHEEVWQSVEGAPFQRITWQYDREAPGSECMGLRMVEADVALHASGVLGYAPAIEMYTEALGPDLEACSVFGMQPEDELALLKGLASLRLMQAQAFDGNMEGAQAAADGLAAELPESLYVVTAQQWLAEYTASGDSEAACTAIAPILEENPDLWKITDHYGYNHPALAAEQICFVP